MAYDKLSTINSALTRTGNNPVEFEGDGSPEWTVAGLAYDDEFPLLLSSHNWGFVTDIVSMERIGESPNANWTDQFRRPAGCLHLIGVLSARDLAVDYDIQANTILVNEGSAKAKIVKAPAPSDISELFLETLRQRVMAHCYRGLNEDAGEATRMEAKAEMTLELARSRSDQEKKPRARIVSGLLRSRGERRGRYGYRGP